MKVFWYFGPVAVFLLALCCTVMAQDVKTDYDRKADFYQYKTYSWTKVQADDALWQPRITDAVDKELQAKGWQLVQSGGDVALTAVGAAHNEQQYQTFYDGMGGWGWGGFGGERTTTVQNSRVGTLVLDMYDAKTKQLIWRATASDAVSSKESNNEQKLEKAVDKMFKDFPPGAHK